MHSSIFLNFLAEVLPPLVFLNMVCGLPLDPLITVLCSEVCVCHTHTSHSQLEAEVATPPLLPLYAFFA